MQNFDFDYWKNLAALSPVEFEQQRRMALQEVRNSSPAVHQPALTTLLETLCTAQQGTPMERAINAQTLMLESLADLKAAWESLVEATGEGSRIERALLNARIQIAPMGLRAPPGGSPPA